MPIKLEKIDPASLPNDLYDSMTGYLSIEDRLKLAMTNREHYPAVHLSGTHLDAEKNQNEQYYIELGLGFPSENEVPDNEERTKLGELIKKKRKELGNSREVYFILSAVRRIIKDKENPLYGNISINKYKLDEMPKQDKKHILASSRSQFPIFIHFNPNTIDLATVRILLEQDLPFNFLDFNMLKASNIERFLLNEANDDEVRLEKALISVCLSSVEKAGMAISNPYLNKLLPMAHKKYSLKNIMVGGLRVIAWAVLTPIFIPFSSIFYACKFVASNWRVTPLSGIIYIPAALQFAVTSMLLSTIRWISIVMCSPLLLASSFAEYMMHDNVSKKARESVKYKLNKETNKTKEKLLSVPLEVPLVKEEKNQTMVTVHSLFHQRKKTEDKQPSEKQKAYYI